MDLLQLAVEDDVAWCARLGPGSADPTTGTWCTVGAPWPLFPDVVTLRPGVRADHVAALLSDRPACSVKDSVADVDLAPHGFRELFRGSWVGRAGPAPTRSAWSRVTDEDGLARWCAAAGLPEVLPARLLHDPGVRVLTGPGGRAVATLTGSVVGVSNVHGRHVWTGLSGALAEHAPGRPVVGYEHGADLAAALAAGFAALGPVRVRVRP